MMKKILFILFLIVQQFVFGQFSHTYFNATRTIGNFSSRAFVGDQGGLYLTSIANDPTTYRLKLTTFNLGSYGEVKSVQKLVLPQQYTLQTSGNKYCMILGIKDDLLYRYFTLQYSSSASQSNILWIKVEKSNHQIVSIVENNGNITSSFIKTIFNYNKLITYAIKDGVGLVRYTMDCNSFSAPSMEVIDASVSTNFPVYAANQETRIGGYLFVLFNREKLVLSNGVSHTTIYTRNTAGNVTKITTGIQIQTNQVVSSFLIDGTTIGVSDGQTLEKYQYGSFVGSYQLPVNIVSNYNHIRVFYYDSAYQFFTYGHDENKYYKINSNYQIIDSARTKNRFNAIAQFLPYQNKLLINGRLLLDKYLPEDIAGNATHGWSSYCELYKTIPTFKYPEYNFHLSPNQSNIQLTGGIGTSFVSDYNQQSEAVFLNGKNLIFTVKDIFQGVTAEGDTLSDAAHDKVFYQMKAELPGPYTYSSDYDEVQEAKYNHVFHVTLQMIQNHIDSIQSGSTTYRPDPNILFWPGNGDPSIGQPAVIAPFADLNNNGKYEPMLGEYPLIYGNDCSFNVTHYPDEGDPSKAMAFRFWTYIQHCDTANVYKNVVFRKIEVISHGAPFDSLQIGNLFDGDIGFSDDDYIGTNVNLGMGYFYNGALNDPGQGGLPALHDTLAATGILYLKGFKQAADGIDNGIGTSPGESVNGYGYNDGIVDNEYKGLYASVRFYIPGYTYDTHTVNAASDWKNKLNGLYWAGDSIGYGGNAYFQHNTNITDTLFTRYMYPYKQDSLHYGTNGIDPGFPWSEFNLYKDTLQINNPSDRMMVLSYGSGALQPGEKITFDYALIANRDAHHSDSIFEPVMGLFAKARRVRSAFLSNEGPCGIHFNLPPNSLGTIENGKLSSPTIMVYPNPAATKIQLSNIKKTGASVDIYSTKGQLMKAVPHYHANQSISIANLSKGMYIIRINEKDKISVRKLLKK